MFLSMGTSFLKEVFRMEFPSKEKLNTLPHYSYPQKKNQNIRDDILEMNNMNPSYTRQAQGEWERGKERHSETTSTKK